MIGGIGGYLSVSDSIDAADTPILCEDFGDLCIQQDFHPVLFQLFSKRVNDVRRFVRRGESSLAALDLRPHTPGLEFFNYILRGTYI